MLMLLPLALFILLVLPILLFARMRTLSERLDAANLRLQLLEDAVKELRPRALTQAAAPSPRTDIPVRQAPAPQPPASTPSALPVARAATAPTPPPPVREPHEPVPTLPESATRSTVETEIGGRWMLVV